MPFFAAPLMNHGKLHFRVAEHVRVAEHRRDSRQNSNFIQVANKFDNSWQTGKYEVLKRHSDTSRMRSSGESVLLKTVDFK